MEPVSNPHDAVSPDKPDKTAENNDLIRQLLKHNAPLVRAINDPECVTKTGRIKLAAVARRLNTTTQQVSEQLNHIRSRFVI